MGLIKGIAMRFDPDRNVPLSHKENFANLYYDFGWVGVLTGSTLAFVSIYSARIGANMAQIGFITAIPAIVNLILALPAGVWLAGKPIERGVVSTSFIYRFFYLPLIFIPLFTNQQTQIWLILLVTIILSIPNTIYAVGYNAFFGEAVPIEWRPHVASLRNASYSFTLIVTSLVCGIILEKIYFPFGYQIVFSIGVVGALLSSISLKRIKINREQIYGRTIDKTYDNSGIQRITR